MKDNSISFLDLRIVIENKIIILDRFHKKTASGRLLSFYSYHPAFQKIGTIIGLIDRAILLSHPRYHSTNNLKCINILMSNGYPLPMVFNHINKTFRRLAKKIKLNRNSDTNDTSCENENVRIS